MKASEKTRNRKAGTQTLLIAVTAFVLVVAVGVGIFLRFYSRYIDGVLYHERLHQMQEVTGQLFAGLEDVVEKQWANTDVFCNYAALARPDNMDDLLTFMKKQARLNEMDTRGSEKLVAIDSLGRCLTQDGWQGNFGGMNRLADEPEKISFVSESLTTNVTTMYFLERLQTPISVQDGERSVQLVYYGMSQNMESLNRYFNCDAYDGNNSVYVLDSQGSRVFRSNASKNPLQAYNAFSSLSEMEYLHGTSFEVTQDELERSGLSYSNAVLDGEEYHYALYRMESADWVLLFLVPSRFVAQDTVSLVRTTGTLVLVFSLVMLGAAVLVIYTILRRKQIQALELERKNRESLEKVNQELSEAVQTAERAEKAAKDASRAKSEFLSNMSHDIRTPMNAIVGITSLMAHEKDDPEKLEQYIGKVQSSSQHLLSLINDVLDMSKIESSDASLSRAEVNLADQIGQVDSIIRPQAETRRQAFTIRVHEISHERLIGDAVRLRQIFINLLSNAVKYTQVGGEISLDLAEKLGADDAHTVLVITVTDNGYGMAPEFVEHIFEPFTRAESSTTNKVQGTGLGMAITKNIIDLMGGTISVESTPHKGSRFHVEVPIEIDRESRCEIDAKNVLLITDEENLVANVTASFRGSGIPLHAARSREEVAEYLRDTPVDTILLSGYAHDPKLHDIVHLLHEEAKDAVLVFCVDYEQLSEADDVLKKSGVDGLIARPFFLSNFANIVNDIRSDIDSDNQDENAALRGMRFLCAEDNALNAEILEAILDMNEASCVIYPNGKQLVEAFENVTPGEFDAILMDVQMPVMNGLDATRAVRRSANPLGKTIPIIAMTANAFSSDVQACLDAGMDAHVPKPLELATLERTLRSVMNAKFSGGGHLSTCRGRKAAAVKNQIPKGPQT